jgi:hypothetical protein
MKSEIRIHVSTRTINNVQWPVIVKIEKDGGNKWILSEICNGIAEWYSVKSTKQACIKWIEDRYANAYRKVVWDEVPNEVEFRTPESEKGRMIRREYGHIPIEGVKQIFDKGAPWMRVEDYSRGGTNYYILILSKENDSPIENPK